MATNNFPGLKKKTKPSKKDFFTKLSIVATDFGSDTVDLQQPDIFISFPTRGVLFLNEGTLASQTVEYSFDGITVHGELNPTLLSKGISFDNRIIGTVWFRLKSGSTGPVTIRVEAWGN